MALGFSSTFLTTLDEPQVLFDFAAEPHAARAFIAVDDRVMGGSSVSSLAPDDGFAVFGGQLVCERGGFASVRTDGRDTRWTMPGTKGMAVVCRGDGHTMFKLSLRMDPRVDGVAYQQDFIPPAGREWRACELPWYGFCASWRGRIVPEAPGVDVTQIRSVGLMVSKWDDHGVPRKEVRTGPFRLEVRAIRALHWPTDVQEARVPGFGLQTE